MRRRFARAVMASVLGRASRGVLGTRARDSEGTDGKDASTPNAEARGDDGDGTSTLGYVDENAGLRFGRIDEDVLRAILANDAEDDPDEMSGADDDGDDEYDAAEREDEDEDEDEPSAETSVTQRFARLGEGAPTEKELRRLERRRARENRRRERPKTPTATAPD